MGGEQDSGVGSRMLGTLLTWLNDHTSDVFFVGTANDVSKLPDALTRAERFDGIYFMDFPSKESQQRIWDLYRDKYNIPASEEQPKDTLWTGAEIRSCCRLARLRDISLVEAGRSILPVHRVGRKGIDQMRKWAENRCISADYNGMFKATPLTLEREVSKDKSSRPRRNISRKVRPGSEPENSK